MGAFYKQVTESYMTLRIFFAVANKISFDISSHAIYLKKHSNRECTTIILQAFNKNKPVIIIGCAVPQYFFLYECQEFADARLYNFVPFILKYSNFYCLVK